MTNKPSQQPTDAHRFELLLQKAFWKGHTVQDIREHLGISNQNMTKYRNGTIKNIASEHFVKLINLTGLETNLLTISLNEMEDALTEMEGKQLLLQQCTVEINKTIREAAIGLGVKLKDLPPYFRSNWAASPNRYTLRPYIFVQACKKVGLDAEATYQTICNGKETETPLSAQIGEGQ